MGSEALVLTVFVEISRTQAERKPELRQKDS